MLLLTFDPKKKRIEKKIQNTIGYIEKKPKRLSKLVVNE
jgi:hypothetical protein